MPIESCGSFRLNFFSSESRNSRTCTKNFRESSDSIARGGKHISPSIVRRGSARSPSLFSPNTAGAKPNFLPPRQHSLQAKFADTFPLLRQSGSCPARPRASRCRETFRTAVAHDEPCSSAGARQNAIGSSTAARKFLLALPEHGFHRTDLVRH